MVDQGWYPALAPTSGILGVRKRPWHDLPWHRPSDQPDQIRFSKRPLRWLAAGEYLAAAVTALAAAPLVATARLLAAGERRPPPPMLAFAGLAVSPGRSPDAQPGLVRELGVRRLLVRAPVWERDRLDRLADFMAGFHGADWLVAVPQDRAAVCCPPRWEDALHRAIETLAPFTRTFQILQAPNRTKWGCYHARDALDLLEGAERVRRSRPGVRLVGPSVIDFEPLALMRLLLNRRRFRLDALAGLLYVDRCGPPEGRQYGIFDLMGKIACMRAIQRCSRRVHGGRLWLTEFNWPLRGTWPWSPTSDREAVDEMTAAEYLLRYFRIAHASGLVERAYWWQLVAPGYGLVDDRSGLRRRPAFDAFRRLLATG